MFLKFQRVAHDSLNPLHFGPAAATYTAVRAMRKAFRMFPEQWLFATKTHVKRGGRNDAYRIVIIITAIIRLQGQRSSDRRRRSSNLVPCVSVTHAARSSRFEPDWRNRLTYGIAIRNNCNLRSGLNRT